MRNNLPLFQTKTRKNIERNALTRKNDIFNVEFLSWATALKEMFFRVFAMHFQNNFK